MEMVTGLFADLPGWTYVKGTFVLHTIVLYVILCPSDVFLEELFYGKSN